MRSWCRRFQRQAECACSYLLPIPGAIAAVQELKFAYEEESSSEEFFVPYLWSVLVPHSMHVFGWSLQAIVLFDRCSATTV